MSKHVLCLVVSLLFFRGRLHVESRRHVATYRANANCWNQLTEKSRLDRVSLALTSNPFILDVFCVNSKSVECIIKSSVRYISLDVFKAFNQS